MCKQSPNGKGMVQVPMEYILMVYGPNGKGMVLLKIHSGNCHGKKIQNTS